MTADTVLAGVAAAWLALPAGAVALDRVDAWRDRRVAEIRSAERQTAQAFDRAIAALRSSVQ